MPYKIIPSIPGDDGNYDRPVMFDKDGGYVSISQGDGVERLDRVLLSPKQVKSLLEFLGASRQKSKTKW